jgi:hypothetical protein
MTAALTRRRSASGGGGNFHRSAPRIAQFRLFVSLVSLWIRIPIATCFTASVLPSSPSTFISTTPLQMSNDREAEIRRKIIQLKKEGKLRNKETKPFDDYTDSLVKKLGTRKAKMLGYTTDSDEKEGELDKIEAELDSYEEEEERQGQLGSFTQKEPVYPKEEALPEEENMSTKAPIIDPSLFENDENDQDEQDLDERDLVELVAQKLGEQKQTKQQQQQQEEQSQDSKRMTSGVGGTWTKVQDSTVETYKPKTGSWGAFERPKDISKAYGGGRRVGAGIDETSLLESTRDTRERLQKYREKVGIDVQSEKDYANDIEEALRIAGYAMQVSTKMRESCLSIS